MALGLQITGCERIIRLHRREDLLRIGGGCLWIVVVGHIREAVSRELDRLALGLELPLASLDPNRDGPSPCVRHLAADGTLPDELVQARLIGPELALGLPQRPELLASRTNGLVSFLSVLRLALVDPRTVRHVRVAVLLLDQTPRRRNGLTREGHRVGTHVGDPSVLVEALRRAHGLLRCPLEATVRLLLQRRGREGRAR